MLGVGLGVDAGLLGADVDAVDAAAGAGGGEQLVAATEQTPDVLGVFDGDDRLDLAGRADVQDLALADQTGVDTALAVGDERADQRRRHLRHLADLVALDHEDAALDAGAEPELVAVANPAMHELGIDLDALQARRDREAVVRVQGEAVEIALGEVVAADERPSLRFAGGRLAMQAQAGAEQGESGADTEQTGLGHGDFLAWGWVRARARALRGSSSRCR